MTTTTGNALNERYIARKKIVLELKASLLVIVDADSRMHYLMIDWIIATEHRDRDCNSSFCSGLQQTCTLRPFINLVVRAKWGDFVD